MKAKLALKDGTTREGFPFDSSSLWETLCILKLYNRVTKGDYFLLFLYNCKAQRLCQRKTLAFFRPF